MKQYTVARLAALAGISVRTLHLYDQIGLLKPAHRSEAGYRRYGEPELLRLQQILFYKEMGLALQEIADILDDPGFDLVRALQDHKKALQQRQQQIQTMLATIDKTMLNLKENNMQEHEALYEGLSREEAQAYRSEAIEKYGLQAVERSEQSLKALTKEELKALAAEQKDIAGRLADLQNDDPESGIVQDTIALHYRNIRRFWGTDKDADLQAATYKGLAELYVNDERYLQTEGRPRPEFALFLKKAMIYFADHRLQ